jgi:hypothetical protein
MVDQILIVNVMLFASFSWSVSRLYAGDEAWKPKYIDLSSDVVAFSSWVVAGLYSVYSGGFAEMSNHPLYSVLGLIGVFGIYSILIAFFVYIRRRVYQYKN